MYDSLWSDVVTARPAGSEAHAEGEGKVIFTRLDGGKIVIDNVRVDSVGPGGEARGVVAAESFDGRRIFHVPFVSHWEFDFRV